VQIAVDHGFPAFSLQLVISEISQSAPMALQAVKLLAEYLGNKIPKV
jgi:hypothetical protein